MPAEPTAPSTHRFPATRRAVLKAAAALGLAATGLPGDTAAPAAARPPGRPTPRP